MSDNKKGEVMSAQELADELGVCYNSVLDFAKRGVLPSIKLGSRVVFSRQAIRDYLYVGSLCGLKNLMDYIGVNHEYMMDMINKTRNYKDRSELELVKEAKKLQKELKKRYLEGTPPDPEMIKDLDAILAKVEVFHPVREVG